MNIKLIHLGCISFALCVFFPLLTFGQAKIKDISDVKFERNEYYLVTLNDKTSILGRFNEIKGEQIIFLTNSNSKSSAHVDDIKHIRKVSKDQVVNGKYWHTNNHNRYFYGQSAFSLQKNEFSFYNHFGVQSALEYGITDHLSMAGGFNIFSLLYPDDYDRLNIISTKVGGIALTQNTTLGFTGIYGKEGENIHGIF